MKIDLCALTEDLLPLYAEGFLSDASKRLVEAHAVECPACRERLQAATAPLAPHPWPESPLDKPARRFFGRLRRTLIAGLATVMALLVVVGSIGYSVGRKNPWEKQLIPARVRDAEAVALSAVPGWQRAKAQGLVTDLGVTEEVTGTQATITLEKAWYSGRQAYILYTVTAPEGQYVLPTEVFLGKEDGSGRSLLGRTDWDHLSTQGGFSADGFHGVLIFPQLDDPGNVQHLKLTFRHWAPVTPGAGLERSKSIGTPDMTALLPWRAAYLQEPAPEVVLWSHQHTWMGRTLALNRLEVSVGRTRLTGEIDLPDGERSPTLGVRLRAGAQVLDLKDFKADPMGPGRYGFTATFDAISQWPAPVKLELYGISFETDRTLEWPVNWAKYRDLDGSEHRLMDSEDQVTVRFYDSDLVSIFTTRSGIAIEQRNPKRAPPYVQASVAVGGRGDQTSPGMELVNSSGEVLTNLGGGGGVIYSDPQGHNRNGFAAYWWDSLPENFRQSDRLILRYVYPSATLVLQETWEVGK